MRTHIGFHFPKTVFFIDNHSVLSALPCSGTAAIAGHLRISEQCAQYRSATAIGYRPRRAAGMEGEEARSVDTRRCIVSINEPHAPKVPLSEVHAAFRGLPLREKPLIQLTLQVRRAK